VALGLPTGIPVVAGMHDGAAANVGTGAIEPGDACLTLGTNFAVRVVTGERPRTDCFGYVVAPGRWAWVNSVPRVATQLDLVATALMATPGEPAAQHERLGEQAADVPLDAPLPCLPLGDDAALLASIQEASRDGFSRGEIYLAMLRTAADGSRGLVDKARSDGAPATRFVATGGGARNPRLLRVLAATLGHAVEVGHPESGLLGAGIAAAIGAGWYASLAEARRAMTPPTATVCHDREAARTSPRKVRA
jgi:sugar (pentulose or hexulose) kinase